MKITNKGSTPDRLIGGSSEAAPKFEVHETTTEHGVAKMRLLERGIEIKPGETVELKPGSFHVMFVGLKSPFAKGDRVKATLEFEKAGKVEVTLDVEAAGTHGPASGPAGHRM
jgi:copper(I)-binding protein